MLGSWEVPLNQIVTDSQGDIVQMGILEAYPDGSTLAWATAYRTGNGWVLVNNYGSVPNTSLYGPDKTLFMFSNVSVGNGKIQMTGKDPNNVQQGYNFVSQTANVSFQSALRLHHLRLAVPV